MARRGRPWRRKTPSSTSAPTTANTAAEWEAQYERQFKALCAARNVKFRAVQVATLRNIRDERYWPNDLKPVLSMFSSKTGSPHFLAIAGSRVIVDTHGIVNWQKLIVPLVE